MLAGCTDFVVKFPIAALRYVAFFSRLASHLLFLDDFKSNSDIVESLAATLSKMPDLERMLAQIHSLSKGSKSPDHPDSR